MVARRAPEIPGDDAGGMPIGICVWAGVPEIDMPTEPVDWLATHAAGAGAARERALAIGRRRKAEASRQLAIIVGEPPAPAHGRAALMRQRPRQPVGADWM